MKAGSAGSALKVLIIDEWTPLPANSGKKIRTWNILKRLAKRHRVSLLCYSEPETEDCGTIREAGITLYTVTPFKEHRGLSLYCDLLANAPSRYPYSVWKHYTLRFEETLKAVLKNSRPDLVHCEWTPYARFLDGVTRTPTLIMAHNIESQILLRRAQRSLSVMGRIFFDIQARKMEIFERRVFVRAGAVAAVTQLDSECLKSWGVKNVFLVENGVDLELFAPINTPSSEGVILFLASLDWYPNVDALSFLLDEIFPRIRKQRPEVTLRIAGRNPSPEIRNRITGRPGVEFVGEVADTRPFLGPSGAVVVPLRIGGGSRIKILEALAMAKAVVSTSIGAEGLAVRNGEHLWIADDPAEFASKTVDVLSSPAERLRLGDNGRRLVEGRYGWDRIAEDLEQAWLKTSGARSDSEALLTSSGAQRQVKA